MICCRAGLARLQILRFHQNVVARLLDLGAGIVQQGTTAELRASAGIDAAGIERAAMELM